MTPCDRIKVVTSAIIGYAYMVVHTSIILYRRTEIIANRFDLSWISKKAKKQMNSHC